MFRSKKGKHDWSNDGNFMSKPKNGWIHPDEQLLPNAGVCYGVKYIGSLAILESMRTLDFDTRTALTMECINRLCIALGLRPNRKFKKISKLDEYLGTQPNICFSCLDVNLTINTDNITVVSINNIEKICDHQMTSVSFASGGDQDTRDFVAYVAKDNNGRSCHVIECINGLAEEVISTIGQAFEIRFKNYLNNKTMQTTHTTPIIPMFLPEQNSESQYYNEYPDESPNSSDFMDGSQNLSPSIHNSYAAQNLPPRMIRREVEYQAPRSNLPIKNIFSYINESNSDALSELKSPEQLNHDIIDTCQLNHSQCKVNGQLNHLSNESNHSNHSYSKNSNFSCNGVCQSNHTFNETNQSNHSQCLAHDHQPVVNKWDHTGMNPFISQSSLPNTKLSSILPYDEIWFHGKITRPQAEELLLNNGDFLVRESPNTPGQFVLSGKQGTIVRHLLLVDPEGKVRTKDQLFNSVGHLVNYHLYNKVPIISMDNELLLKHPIIRRD